MLDLLKGVLGSSLGRAVFPTPMLQSMALAVGGAVLWGLVTRPRPIDMDAWRENGSFTGIDMLCAIGAQHEDT